MTIVQIQLSLHLKYLILEKTAYLLILSEKYLQKITLHPKPIMILDLDLC